MPLLEEAAGGALKVYLGRRRTSSSSHSHRYERKGPTWKLQQIALLCKPRCTHWTRKVIRKAAAALAAAERGRAAVSWESAGRMERINATHQSRFLPQPKVSTPP